MFSRILLLALAPALPPLQDADPDAGPRFDPADQLESGTLESYSGAAFDLEHPPELEVTETANGQVHFLELRRPGIDDAGLEPLIKLLVVPGAAGQLEVPAFLTMLENELIGACLAKGQTHEGSESVTRTLLGQEVAGRRITMSSPLFTQHFELTALAADGHLFGAQTVVTAGSEDELEPMIADVLADLSRRAIDATTVRTERIGPYALEVPFLTAEGRQTSGSLESLQLGFAEGSVELVHQAFAEPWEATFATTSFRSQRREQVESVVGGTDAVVEEPRWDGLWIRDGILEGEVITVHQGEAATDIHNLALAADGHLLCVAFETPAAAREAMGQRMRQVLGTLTMPGSGGALDAALGRRHMHQDHGLTWVHPAPLRLTRRASLGPGEPTRVSLASPSQDPESLAWFFGDVHVAPLPAEETLADELGRLVREAYPEATLAEGWAVGAVLLGEQREGWTLPFATGGHDMHLTAVTASHRGGTLVAGGAYPAADSSASLWTLANLLARVTLLPDGPRRLTSSDWAMGYDPATWVVTSSQDDGVHQVSLEPRSPLGSGSDSLHIVTGMGIASSSGATPGDLLRQAEAGHRLGTEHQARQMNLPVGVEVERETTRRVLRLGGTLAVHHRDIVRAQDPSDSRLLAYSLQDYAFDRWTLLAEGRSVEIRATSLADDAEVHAAFEELVEGFDLERPVRFADRPTIGGGLALTVPPTLRAELHPDGEDDFLELTPIFSELELAVLRCTPTGPEPDLAKLEGELRFQLQLLSTLDDGDAQPHWAEPVEASLAGRPATLHRCEVLKGGDVLFVAEGMQTVTDGVLRQVTLLSAPGSKSGLREAVLDLVADAEPLPRLRHLEGEGLTAEVDPGRFTPEADGLAVTSPRGRGALSLGVDGQPDGSGEPTAVAALLERARVRPASQAGAARELTIGGRKVLLPLPAGVGGSTSESSMHLTCTEAGRGFDLWGHVHETSERQGYLDVVRAMQELSADGQPTSGMTLVRRELLGRDVLGRRFHTGGEVRELYAVPLDGEGTKLLGLRASWKPGEDGQALVDVLLDGLELAD